MARKCVYCKEASTCILCTGCMKIYHKKFAEVYCVSCEEGCGRTDTCTTCSPAFWANQERSTIESTVFDYFLQGDIEQDLSLAKMFGESYLHSLDSLKRSQPELVGVESLPNCDCGKNWEDGCNCLPF